MLGDNTDGIGLLGDLERLNFIRRVAYFADWRGRRIRGVLLPLLSLDCAVTITNRTASRAEALAKIFAHTGSVHATDMDKLDGCEFDLIINATSSGIRGEIPAIPASLIHPSLCCYDMFYQKGIRHFSLVCTTGRKTLRRWAGNAGGAGCTCRFALARCITAGRASD